MRFSHAKVNVQFPKFIKVRKKHIRIMYIDIPLDHVYNGTNKLLRVFQIYFFIKRWQS